MKTEVNSPLAANSLGSPLGTQQLLHSPEVMKSRLELVRPQDLLIVSDMTGTLVRQQDDGFTPGQKQNLTRLLDQGATLVLSTADPLPEVEKHFLHKLNYQGRGTLILITSAGYLGHNYSPEGNQELFTGRSIPISVRASLMQRVEQSLCAQFALDRAFTDEQRAAFLSPAGARLSIQHLAPDQLGPKAAVDVFRGKVSIFFLDHPINTPVEDAICNRIRDDAGVAAVVNELGLYLFKGNNYIDILSCTKFTGLDALNGCGLPEKLNFKNKTVLVLGDSTNDEGLFVYPYQNSNVMRAFLGSDAKLVEAFRAAAPQHPIAFLKEQFIAGSEVLLAAVGTRVS